MPGSARLCLAPPCFRARLPCLAAVPFCCAWLRLAASCCSRWLCLAAVPWLCLALSGSFFTLLAAALAVRLAPSACCCALALPATRQD
eukprot:3956476-Karenia_brevis.AAC.1